MEKERHEDAPVWLRIVKKVGRYLLVVFLCWVTALVLVVASIIPALNEEILDAIRSHMWRKNEQ
jgi:hypothetical protein